MPQSEEEDTTTTMTRLDAECVIFIYLLDVCLLVQFGRNLVWNHVVESMFSSDESDKTKLLMKYTHSTVSEVLN